MVKENDWNLELSEYIKQGEASEKEKTKIWETAIGLQEVDGLKTSKYLVEQAKEHIEGNINIEEVKTRIDEYYEVQGSRKSIEEGNEEADKVSVRIAELLSEKAFNFTPTELLNIHKRLFKDVFAGAGVYRDYNFTKKEWVLNGDTVIYAPFEIIKETLEYDFEQEKNFSYNDLTLDESIKHLCKFTSNIWQIHPFCEGNTRTIAVFMIKYLRTFGFYINDEVFADNSWYFRNALVRANYRDFDKNVYADTSFLEKFFYNLLTGAKHELKNRNAHIDYDQKETKNEIAEKEQTKTSESALDSANTITLQEQAILNMLKENPEITQEEIATSLNKSSRTVKRHMANMQQKGLIERKNGKKSGKWLVKLINEPLNK